MNPIQSIVQFFKESNVPFQRIEQAGGTTAIWGSAAAVFGQLLGWVSENATVCGLMIALGGLIIQAIAAHHTRKIRNAEEARRIEEHQLQVQVLQSQLSQAESRASSE